MLQLLHGCDGVAVEPLGLVEADGDEVEGPVAGHSVLSWVVAVALGCEPWDQVLTQAVVHQAPTGQQGHLQRGWEAGGGEGGAVQQSQRSNRNVIEGEEPEGRVDERKRKVGC